MDKNVQMVHKNSVRDHSKNEIKKEWVSFDRGFENKIFFWNIARVFIRKKFK